jgi:hypothetical protein
MNGTQGRCEPEIHTDNADSDPKFRAREALFYSARFLRALAQSSGILGRHEESEDVAANE